VGGSGAASGTRRPEGAERSGRGPERGPGGGSLSRAAASTKDGRVARGTAGAEARGPAPAAAEEERAERTPGLGARAAAGPWPPFRDRPGRVHRGEGRAPTRRAGGRVGRRG
jgi:hypothetical protein